MTRSHDSARDRAAGTSSGSATRSTTSPIRTGSSGPTSGPGSPPSARPASPTTCSCVRSTSRRRSPSRGRFPTSASSSTTSPSRRSPPGGSSRGRRWMRPLGELAERLVQDLGDGHRGRPDAVATRRSPAVRRLACSTSSARRRLLFGSDWPVCLLVAPYEAVFDAAVSHAPGLERERARRRLRRDGRRGVPARGPVRWSTGRDDRRRRRPRRPLPDLAHARRLGRDEPRPRLLGRLRDPPDRCRRRPRGPRLHVHHRPRHRGGRGRDRGAQGPDRRPVRADAVRRHGRPLARARRRQPAPLDRPGEGRHPSRHRGAGQRGLGPRGEAGRQAALEAPGRHDARRARGRDRLPLHHRRAHARATRADMLAGRAATSGRARGDRRRDGYPAYTTSVGWLGYPDDKIRRLCRGGAGRRLDALQDEGRRRPRRRHPPRRRSSARRSGPTGP